MKLTDIFIKSGARVRHNHALEHATLQLLARRKPGVASGGYSDADGFWIVGDYTAEDILQASEEALLRLRAGEHGLAIHPNCGTNFAATGMAAGTAAWLAMLIPARTWRSRLDRWPAVVLLATAAVMLSAPLGPWLQRNVTTDGNVGRMEIASVTRYPQKRLPLHRVKTKG